MHGNMPTNSGPSEVQVVFDSLPEQVPQFRLRLGPPSAFFVKQEIPERQEDDSPIMETNHYIGPQIPVQNGSSRFENASFRVPSPVSTEARDRALQLIAEKDSKKRKLDGVGDMLKKLRGGGSAETPQTLPVFVDRVPRPLTQPVHVSVGRASSPASRSSASSLSGFSNSTGPLSAGPITPGIGPSSFITNNSFPVPTLISGHNATGFVGSMTTGHQNTAGPPQYVPYGEALGPDDVPAPPPHPTDPREIRKLMRSKMHRCKRCKNRFIEKGIYERHLRDRHPDDYILYLAEQEEEMDAQRQEELEQMRIEELQCGGFIPPQSEVESANYEVEPDGIPLPGEGYGGVAPSFDSYGGLKIPRRPYKKKISPQCPFCDKRFRNENSLKKHVAKKHADAMEYVQCNKCFKSLRSIDLVPTHTCELLYVCYECTPIRNLCNDQRLFNHRAKFHRGPNSGFRCNECSRKFLTPRKLRKHKKMAHVVTKPFKCNFCDEFFPTETQVSLHERIHTGKIKYECSVCDFKTNRFVKLDKHKREDHGYLCSICQDKIGEWAQLKHHTLDKHGGYLTSERNARCIESPRVWVMYKGE